ncbi:uncharacterized protein LOC126970948 isoform X1 [Leptidea sinapis]|uniref:uncharacterized protein LOC126970948 isoform X1 n=1 Tax=Leptidea sinapis TaxID=189913 RepID=UPI00212266D9|nr:uncharacterized protein LOC126970948 isoform X1 [Leptidea sinapis]
MLPYLVSMIMIILCSVLLFKYCFSRKKPLIFGIYQQRNATFLFKFVTMYVILKIRKLKVYLKRLLAAESDSGKDGVIHVQEHDACLEKLYDLGGNEKAVDGVYFNGMSKSGDAVICGIARRPQRHCDAFLYLKISGEDIFLTPSLPDTYLKKCSDDHEGHSVQGLSATNFMPMRTWKLLYNGEMNSKSQPDLIFKVEANITWSAIWAPFEYDTQMSARSVANDMARETWSAEYFQLLKKFHQTHYEQMGYLKGTVSVDTKKLYEINMPCIRDRSFGPLREWRNFHRYVYHFIFLDNDDFIAVGTVSQPCVLSHLTIGYYCRKIDQSVKAIDSSDFQLYQHGENGNPPKDYGFIFSIGHQSYAVKVQAYDEVSFFIGKEREAKFYERWSNIEVNDIKGRACVEWHYNNVVPK